ncbi:zinc finger C2HC domain-containing protein 1C-like [Polypterus senegalus]
MANLKMAPYPHIDNLPSYERNINSTLPAQHSSKTQSRLELLKSNFQQKQLQEKERKMIALYDQQQQAALSRVRSTFSHQTPPSEYKVRSNKHGGIQQRGYNSAGTQIRHNYDDHFEHKAASLSASKKTSGVDRAHPLKPVYYRKSASLNNVFVPQGKEKRETTRFPSVPSAPPDTRYNAKVMRKTSEGQNPEDMVHYADPYSNSRGGSSKSESIRAQQQQAEEAEQNLEEEIHRKEALLREKLRRTEEELRRIQRERELIEEEEKKEKEERTQRKRSQLRHYEYLLEESDGEWKHEYQGTYRAHRRTGQPKEANDRRQIQDQLWVVETNERRIAKSSKPYSNQMANTGKADRMNPNSYDDLHTHQKYMSVQNVQSPQSGFIRSAMSSNQDIGDMDDYISTGSQKEFGSPKNTQHSFQDALQDADSQLVACHLCKRKFAVERLEKHSQVCMKTQNSKRKTFDSSKHRAQGTDLEQFNKNRRTISTPPKPKNNWRQKHESFIRNLQQSREVQKIVQKGGKLSDLPPLPPDDNPDYILCPHCSRKFAPRVAERHIPKCENIKSRPPPPPRKNTMKRY